MTALLKTIPNPLLPNTAPHTTADLHYYEPPANGEVPYDRLYPSPLPDTNVVPRTYKTPIYDLRPLVDAGREGETSVDVTGFQIVGAKEGKTVLREEDWADEEKVRGVYYSEVERMLKKVLGASKVIIFDHTIRRVEKAGEETPDTPDSRKPVAKVHIDQTPASGLRRVYRHAGEDAERLLRGRAQLINVWRPLRGPVLDRPLAIADSRSVNPSLDLVPSRLLYAAPTPEGETFQIAHNTSHRWYYLSAMGPDEALLLKCWENAEDSARTPHTGITDDAFVGQDVIPRQSIEIRALVFHELEE